MSALLTELLSEGRPESLVSRSLRRRLRDGEVQLGPQSGRSRRLRRKRLPPPPPPVYDDGRVLVLASGSLGLVYLTGWGRRLTLEEIEGLHPHLVSTLLAARLLHGERSQLGLAGQGLQDVTRLAGGSAELWTDILGSNAVAVADGLADFAHDVDDAVEVLRGLSTAREPEQRRTHLEALSTVLVRGVQGRARLPVRGGTSAPSTSTAYAAAPRGA